MTSLSAERRTRHPDAPWLWRADWARGVVRSGIGSGGARAWLATLASRWRRFGNARISLETLPGSVGGRLAATFHAGSTIENVHGFRVRLICFEHRRRGKQETRSSVAWQHEQHVPAREARPGPFGTALPVSFEIPPDAPPTRLEPEDGVRHSWQLEVGAALSGTHLRSSFEVPVFRAEASDPEPSPAEAGRANGARAASVGECGAGERAHAIDAEADGEAAGVFETLLPDGGVELFFPPGGKRAGVPAFALLVFAALVAIGFATRGVPDGWLLLTLPPIAFAALLLPLLGRAARLQSTHLRARRGELALTRSWLGPGQTRIYRGEEIEAIAAEEAGRAGETTRYRLRLVLRSGRRRLAGSEIPSKQEALRLAHALWHAVHREPLGHGPV